eukprot:TRINITY_DN8221_c0_g1_i2.p1 TRINITY_DN8221_c0_g1~~TRINITY_DN8221_c0_g1_i2.p1  ORF type:complete len:140 (+),score=16.26 TRINITY_DN8221_c0_g1_i2:177-596(+)
MQQFFKESSGATLHPATFKGNNSNSLVASAITWQRSEDNCSFLRIKIVNFGSNLVNLTISVDGLESNSVDSFQSTKTVLTSNNLMDENSFAVPNKVRPVPSALKNAGTNMAVLLDPHSFTALDLSIDPTNDEGGYKSSI